MSGPIENLKVRNLFINHIDWLEVYNIQASNEIVSKLVTADTITSAVSITGKNISCNRIDLVQGGTINVPGTVTSNVLSAQTFIGLPVATIGTSGLVTLDDSYTSSSRTTVPTSNALYQVKQQVDEARSRSDRWVTQYGKLSYSLGNVGIGTTNPSALLNTFGGDVRIDRGNIFVTDPTAWIVVGSNAPARSEYKLDVTGDIFVNGNIYISGNIIQV